MAIVIVSFLIVVAFVLLSGLRTVPQAQVMVIERLGNSQSCFPRDSGAKPLLQKYPGSCYCFEVTLILA